MAIHVDRCTVLVRATWSAALCLTLLAAAPAAWAVPQEEPEVRYDTAELVELPPLETSPIKYGPGEPAPEKPLEWLIPLLLLLFAILWWLKTRSAEEPERERGQRIAAALFALAFLAGGVILAQEGGGDASSGTQTRTRRGTCELAGEFGLRVMLGNRAAAELLFVSLVPGLYIDAANGRLVMKEKDVELVSGSFPGTIRFQFRRGADGTAVFYDSGARAVASNEDIGAVIEEIGTSPPTMNPPDGFSARNTPITERLQGEVDYTPDDPAASDCPPLRSPWLTVTWRWPPRGEDASWSPIVPVGNVRPPRWRSRVRISPEIIDETTGFPGEVNKATHTQVTFKVDEPYRCCGAVDTPHAIIQFVRHRWQFTGEDGRVDDWNLDGPESQSERRAQGQDYDPTYTTDPHHGTPTANEDNGLVHVGPWDRRGGNAISVDDYPGLLEPDHDLFVQRGGRFQWEFVTLLVCREATGSAPLYLASGKVRAITTFKIERAYPVPPSNDPIEVGAEFPHGNEAMHAAYYEPCRDLAEVLRELDDSDDLNANPERDDPFTNAFNNPRPHRVQLR